MIPELDALLTAGATAVVTAAATRAGGGAWEMVRSRIAALFGRGNAARAAAVAR